MRNSFARGPISGILVRPEERPLGRLSNVRWSLLLVALMLSVVGAATVHSASAEMPIDYLPRQAAWVGIGLLLLFVALSVDHQRLASFALPLYMASLALLGLVLVVGQVRGGSRGWFGLGAFAVQPSELAKFTTALMLARYLAGVEGEHLKLRQIAVAVLIVAAPVALVAIQPDLGGAAMYAPMLGAMLLVAGIKKRLLAVSLLLAVVGGGLAWTYGMQPYQRDRILTFLSPETDPQGAGYQVRQSKIAVGSGELLGKGYRQGTQSQLRFLPARHTDFIFAVLAEEWGFLGVAFVLGLYGVFLFGAAEVAVRARDRLGILLVVGLLATLGFHILYNSAMVVGLVPITGIPLPFLSYGGSFTMYAFAATGVFLGVDYRRYVNR
ncbi:MAG TPA: rod shape-determining protein RodA [Thermoanaerobaculia bacterium]|nr:rod shape-determining protein RodA [Thermoanaerobaculia bacterium]